MKNKTDQLTAFNITIFFNVIQEHTPPIGWCYRGHEKTEWELKPKAGREEFFDSLWSEKQLRKPSLPDKDLGRFKAWCDEAAAFTSELPENDFERLALAQHYGLATRLLDWTKNPFVALFFACKKYGDFNGFVYCYLPNLFIDSKKLKLKEVEVVACYEPRPFNQRIHNQKAMFTYHPHPEIALERALVDTELKRISKSGYNLECILIPKEAKSIILRELHEIGIDDSFLFPDLDGLSDLINWGTRRDVNFKRKKLQTSG